MAVEIKLYDYEDPEYPWIQYVIGEGDNSGTAISAKIEAATGEEVLLRINSVGGSCYAAIQIITAIKKHGNVTAQIDGVCFSAAAAIAACCKKVTGYSTVMLMIHNSRINIDMWGEYTGKDLEQLFEQDKNQLEAFDKMQVAIFTAKTGLPEAEIVTMLEQETWMNGQEAKDLNFIDELEDGVLQAISRAMYNIAFAKAPMRMVAMAGKNLKITENKTMNIIDEIRAEIKDLKAKYGKKPKAEGETPEPETTEEVIEDAPAPETEQTPDEVKAELASVKEELAAEKAKNGTAEASLRDATALAKETRELLAQIKSNYAPAPEQKDFNKPTASGKKETTSGKVDVTPEAIAARKAEMQAKKAGK